MGGMGGACSSVGVIAAALGKVESERGDLVMGGVGVVGEGRGVRRDPEAGEGVRRGESSSPAGPFGVSISMLHRLWVPGVPRSGRS